MDEAVREAEGDLRQQVKLCNSISGTRSYKCVSEMSAVHSSIQLEETIVTRDGRPLSKTHRPIADASPREVMVTVGSAGADKLKI